MKTPFPVYYSALHEQNVMDVPKEISAEFWQAQGCRWAEPPVNEQIGELRFGGVNAAPHRPPPIMIEAPERNVETFGASMIAEFCEWWYARLQ